MSIKTIREKALNSVIVPVAVAVIGISMIVGIFVSFSPSSQSGQDNSPNAVHAAFTANGWKMSDQFFKARLAQEAEAARMQGQTFGPSQEVQRKGQLIDEMVKQAVIAAAAEKAGLSVSNRDINNFLDEQYQGQVKQAKDAIFRKDASKKSDSDLDEQLKKGSQGRQSLDFIRSQVEAAMPRDFVESALLAKQYTENIQKKILVSDAMLKDSYRAVTTRHILISNATRPDAAALKRAKEVLAKLKAGGDFAALAKQYSDDTGSKDKGGLYPAQMLATSGFVPEYMQAALALEKPGDYTQEPVKTQFGYHIIRLDKSEMQLPKDFDKNKEKLRKDLQKKLADQAWAKESERLMKHVKLTFDNPALEAFYFFNKAANNEDMAANAKKAETAFKKALVTDNNDASLYVGLSYTQGMLNKPKEAMATLKGALDGDKFDDAQSRLALGGMLMSAGKKKEAFEQFKRASEYTVDPQVHMELLQRFKNQFKDAKLAAYSQQIVDRFTQQQAQQQAMQRKMMEEANKAKTDKSGAKKPAQGDSPSPPPSKEPR